MVNGINSNNSVQSMSWYNMAQMNDLKLGLSGAKVQGVPSVGNIFQQKPSESDQKFLKDYQSAMTNLMSAANALNSSNSKNVMNELGVQSSSKDVMTAKNLYKLSETASYAVDVKQLASAQVNRSDAVSANAAPTSGGSFRLKTGKGTFQFDIDSTQASSNRELYSEIAKEINAMETGVQAKVVESGGKVSLELTGDQTGQRNAFAVSGAFAEQTGLGTVAQASRDAVYTVDKAGDASGAQEYTSSSNTATIDGLKIEATFKDTGKSQLTVGPDTEKTTAALQDLVDSYNSTLKLLSDNQDRGVTVLKQMRNMLLPPTSPDSLKLAGISTNADGTLSLDKAAFQTRMTENPSLTRDIIGGSYGMARGIAKDAQTALNVSSSSLLGEKASQAGVAGSQTQQSIFDKSQISLLNAYSRNGIYNMTNYYTIGAMMNFNI